MQLTLAIKLAPTAEQHAALVATLERFNAACNAIAQVAFRERLSNKFALQKIVYFSIRERFGLSSQMTIRAIAKVVEVDLGIVNVAVDSDATVYAGERVEQHRRAFAHRRRNLQRRQTRAAKRKLQVLRRKQARFQTDSNHGISKTLVRTAKDTGPGIALENLKGIRDRTPVRRRQRVRHANWAFAQLAAFVQYKAAGLGVPVVLVDPRYSSQTCLACGHVERANRASQARFECIVCGFAGPADAVAACVISARARAACQTAKRPSSDWQGSGCGVLHQSAQLQAPAFRHAVI